MASPVGYQANGTICTKMHTLPSALKNKDVTMQKIQAEIYAGRVLGPFNQPPLPNLALSPIGLVPKKILGEFRLIHHLSYPAHKSVNDSIPDSAATVAYTNVGAAIDVIRQLGRGCLMSKTDIEKAFRLIPIRNDEHHLLGFSFLGSVYYDTCLPMGLKSSCKIFETFSSALEVIARKRLNIAHIVHLLDDFMIFARSTSQCRQLMSSFLAMCRDLGIPMSKEKTFMPATTMTFLGIELDSITFEARLPLEKLDKCKNLINEALCKKKLTLKELQQLTGLLNFACQVIVPGRAFLRRLINLSIGLTKPYQHVRITDEVRNDLKSWLTFLNMFNGKVLFDYGPWISSDCMHLFTDASGTKGFGAIFKPHWFFGKWPLDWHSRSISFLELYPIMASLCVWAEKLRNRRIILHTDNMALEAIINNSTSKNTAIMFLVRKIVNVCMLNNIHIRARHIPGKRNQLADMLSRFQVEQFLKQATWADKDPTKLAANIQPANLFQH